MELEIGRRIRELRKKRDLTQEEVAGHLGISFQAISKWERGEGYPDITMLPALAGYFDTSVDDLLGMKLPRSKPIRKSAANGIITTMQADIMKM